MKGSAFIRMVITVAVIPAFIVLHATAPLAVDPPTSQNSAHLDGQNTDLSDQTLVITATTPSVNWINDDPTPAGAMTGCNLGMVMVESRNDIYTPGGSVIATVMHDPTPEDLFNYDQKFYLRKLSMNKVEGGSQKIWDYPTTGAEWFNEFAYYSAPIVDGDGDIFFGDSDKIVKITQDISGQPQEVQSWELGRNSGVPVSFHLCRASLQEEFKYVMSVTNKGRLVLIYGDDSGDKFQAPLFVDGKLFRTMNTVGISKAPENYGIYSYVITEERYPGPNDEARLFLLKVMKTGDNRAYLKVVSYKSFVPYSSGATSHASPTVVHTEGLESYEDYVIFDVYGDLDMNQVNEEWVVCLKHTKDPGTGEDVLLDAWQIDVSPGNIKASLAYSPIWDPSKGAWRNIVWFHRKNGQRLTGIEIDGQDAGKIVANLKIADPIFTNYVIRSVPMVCSQSTGPDDHTNPWMVLSLSPPNQVYNCYVVAIELEIAGSQEQSVDKHTKWKYELEQSVPGYWGGVAGNYLIRNKSAQPTLDNHSLAFGQFMGKLICINPATQ